jgi:hypothetical protein
MVVKIPFNAFGAETAPIGSVWGLNLCRANRENGELSQWFVTQKTYHDPRRFGAFSFGEPAAGPAIVIESPMLGYGRNVLVVRARNPVQAVEAVVVVTLLDSARKAVKTERKTIVLPAGQSEMPVEFDIPAGFQDDSGRLTAQAICGGRSAGFLMRTASLTRVIEARLPLAQVYTSDEEIAGVAGIRLGQATLKTAALTLKLKGSGVEKSASVAPVPGNHLRFALSPKGLQPGEYSLRLSVAEGRKELGATDLCFAVIKPPFDF